MSQTATALPRKLEPCVIVLALLGFCCSNCTTGSKSMEDNVSPDRMYRAIEPQSGLQGNLTLVAGSDGGCAAVAVELRNPSADHDVVLKVNTEEAAFIMLTVSDESGTVLSRPARRFDSSEVQRIDMVRIPVGSSHRWRAPIAAQLDASALPEQGMKGRLVVNVALHFSKVSRDSQPSDADFKISVLTLYDVDTRFTRTALAEGKSSP